MKLLRNIRISQRVWLIMIIALASTLMTEGLSLSNLHREIRDGEIVGVCITHRHIVADPFVAHVLELLDIDRMHRRGQCAGIHLDLDRRVFRQNEALLDPPDDSGSEPNRLIRRRHTRSGHGTPQTNR